MQKDIENLEFGRVNFECIDSLRNNGTKFLLIFDDSCDKICNSKVFVGIDTAGRRRELSTTYTNQTWFIKANMNETLSSKTVTLFSPKLPVM